MRPRISIRGSIHLSVHRYVRKREGEGLKIYVSLTTLKCMSVPRLYNERQSNS